jgi:hypothetical protein
MASPTALNVPDGTVNAPVVVAAACHTCEPDAEPGTVKPGEAPPYPCNAPVVVTFHPTPLESAAKGISADPDAVVKYPRMPVPVFEAVSVHFIRLAVLVADPAVNTVV